MASEPDLSQMTDDEIYAYYGVDNPNREQTADNAESPVGSAQFQNQGQPQVSEEDLAAVKADSFDGDVSPVAEGFKTFFGSLFTGQGRKDAMDNYRLQTRSGGKVAKTAGYLSDLGNAFYQGLLGGASHVTEAVGNLTGWDDLADESKRYREKLAEYAPTDMTDTGALDENGVPRKRSWGDRIAETGKDVMRIMGEFAPAAASGGTTMAARAAGSAASWGLVGAGGVNTGFDIYRTTVENAEKNGLSKAEAVGLGIAGGAIDVFANAFLMGKFTGKGAKPIEEKFFQTFIKRQLGGAVKTGATMGASGGAQNVIQQMAENGEVDLEATGDAIIDSIIQGAMFHLMNGALHAPIEWSHYRTSQALNGRAADTASAAEDEAATEKMAESELGEYNAESIAVESARKVLGDEQGAAMFCNRYGDAAKEFIAARMRGADVPVEAAKDIGDLAKAFQTQEDMNAFGDRLLQYMNDAYSAKAEERAGWDRNLKNAEEEKKEETRKRVNGVDEEGVNAAFGGEQNARPSDMTRDSRIPRRVNQPNGHANTETNDHAVKIASDAERTHEEGGRIPRRINQPRGNRAEEGDPQTVMRAEEARNTDAEADEARAFGEDVSVANEDYAGYYEWLGGREDTAAMRYAFSREQQQDNARRVIREMTAKRAEDAKAEPAEEVAEQKRDSESAKQSATEEAKAETSEPAAADPEKKSTLVRLVDAIKAGDGDVGRAVENELREEIRAGKVPTEAEIDAATDGMGDVAKNAIRKHIGQMEDAAKAETSKTAETDAKTPEGESAPVQAKTNAEVREDAYNAWLKRQVGKSGKPKKDSKSMRMQFDKMVTDGKVDAKTGEDISANPDDVAEKAQKKTPAKPVEEKPVSNAEPVKTEMEMDTPVEFDTVGEDGKPEHVKGAFQFVDEDGMAVVDIGGGRMRKYAAKDVKAVKADTKDDAKDEKTPVAEQAKDESPSAQSTDLASLGAKAKVAQAKLKSLAIKTDAELMKHRAMLDKMGKKEMVEAIDDLIAYRKASRGGEAKHVAKNTDEPKTEAKKTGATYEKKVERIVDAFKSDGQRGIADAVMDLTKEEASKLANSVESRNVKGLETAGVGGLAKYIRAMHGLDLVDGRPAREWTVKKTEKGYIATNGTVSSQEFTGKNAKYKADNYANEFNLRNPVHGPVGVEGTERTPEQLKADEADAKLRLRDAKRTAKNEKKQLVDAIDRRIDLETSGESVQPLMVEVESKRELLRIAEEAGDRNRIARAKEDLDNALRSIRVGEGPIKIGNAEYSVRNLKQLMDLRDNIEKKYGRNITRFNSRTVGDASADDPALLDRLGKRMAKLVPGIKVKVGELSDGAKASGAVAEFDPKTGEVVVSKDASMSDVVHEIGGHGTFEWAKKNAPALYRKCLEYVRTAPKEVKDFVYENYGDFSPDKLVHEIFANRFAREHGAEFQKLLEEPKPRKWWTNILNAVRSVFQDAARRNGVDTSKLRGMDADGFMKGVAEQMAMGREMNGWTAFGRDAKYLEGAGVKVAPVGGGDNENDETLNSRAANQYDERTEDGRRFNEKYADADVSDAHVGKSAVDKLGAGGKELDATLAARRANAGEEKDGVLLYSRSGLRGDGGVEQDILRHEKERFGDGEARKRGMETIAVVRDGDFVYKYRDARTGLENERTKVARHNELFGDKTPYEIVDFASDKDGEVLVLKQPYVDFVPKSGNIARKQLEAYLRRRFGKVEVSEDGTEMRAGGWIVDDLKDANVGVDAKTGRYAVIDALVHRAEDFGGNAPKMDTADGGERGGATVIGPGVEDGADGGKLYSRVRHPLPSGLSPDRQYMDRERTGKESVRDSYMTNLADRYHRVKSALVDAKMADGMTRAEAEAWATNSKDSPYHQQRVLSGKTEKDMVRARAMESDFRDDLKAIANAGLDSDDVGVFAYAMHAKDRNAQKLADHGVKDGSGISDALADDIVNGRAFSLDGGKTTKQYTPAQLKELARVHDRIVHAMNDEYGLDYLREHGLIDEASVNRLKKAYGRNWVSLADDISEDGVDYNVGTSVSNPLKKAKGRTSVLEDNPVITSMLGMMNNIVNARRNDSANTLARFVEAHPEMGEVRPMTPTDKVDDATIVFRRNNEDPKTGAEKNQKMVIVLHGNRGAEVARSFSDADVSRAPGWLQNASRWWASFATQLSPTFSVRNFLKDTMEVTLDTMGTDGVGAAASFLKGQIAMLPIRNNEFRRTFVEWQRTGKVTGTSQLAQDFKKFVDSGALIGGGGAREGYAEANASAKDIARRVGGAQGAFRKAGELVDWYTDKVGTVNESIETLTRFNNFRNRIARDETPEQAAINSREGSTDFGMYGNQRWMNSVWMFSNSILGGTMRAAKTMKVGKYGPRLAAGMIAFGMLEEFANAAMGGDDDRNDASGGRAGKNVSEYDRENSIRLRVGDQFVKVPVHLGPWSVLKYTGGNVARALMGQISWNQALVNSTNSAATVLSHFSGTGEKGFGKDSPSLVNSMTPSVFQPLVQVGMNENYKGDKIHREHDMGDAKYAPDFKYAKKGTGSLWVELSRALNSISGGSDLVKGRMSVPPEDIEYFVKQIVKNFGTDVVNTFVETPSLAYEIATGKTKLGDPDSLRRVPVVKDVVKSVPDIANRYYEAVNAHAEERQAYRAAQGREKAEYLKAHPAAAANLRKFEDRIKRLSSLARGEITDKHGKVVRTYEPTLKRKEELRAAIRKQMANYLRLARKQ